nr:hypothetical protein [Tanacetum cinerariifolium]
MDNAVPALDYDHTDAACVEGAFAVKSCGYFFQNWSSLSQEPCPRGSTCGTCRGYGFCEEVRILLPELIFTFLCELMTSPGVPSNLDNENEALL